MQTNKKATPTRLTHVQASEVIAILRELATPRGEPPVPLIDAEKLTRGRVYRIVAQRVCFPVNITSVEHLAAELGVAFYREPKPEKPAAVPDAVGEKLAAVERELAAVRQKLDFYDATMNALTASCTALARRVNDVVDAQGANVDNLAAIEQKLNARLDAIAAVQTQRAGGFRVCPAPNNAAASH